MKLFIGKTIKVGDKVTWRGAWGTQPPRTVTVTGIELCEAPDQKHGIKVGEVFLADKNRAVFDLDTGNWAYGYQIGESS